MLFTCRASSSASACVSRASFFATTTTIVAAERALAYLFDSLNRFGNCRPFSAFPFNSSLAASSAARDLRPTRSTP